MARTSVSTKIKQEGTKPEYVTQDQFAQLEKGVTSILDRMETLLNPGPAPLGVAQPANVAAPSVPETPMEKDVRKAGANDIPMNPEWEELAREIIGDAVDHCELTYLKNGGVLFTVVIKKEYSNSGSDYLERMGSDRRSREIGSEGIEGVENWSKLIKSNLSKGTPIKRR